MGEPVEFEPIDWELQQAVRYLIRRMPGHWSAERLTQRNQIELIRAYLAAEEEVAWYRERFGIHRR